MMLDLISWRLYANLGLEINQFLPTLSCVNLLNTKNIIVSQFTSFVVETSCILSVPCTRAHQNVIFESEVPLHVVSA